MTSPGPQEALRFAHHLADVADGISLPAFERGATARSKADGTLVTEADEAVERALRAELAQAFPDHGILGEEEGASQPGAGARWIIDPIDGTNNYAWGIPIWATLIAYEANGEVQAGVVSAPALGERYDAARGEGAHRNGETIRVSEVGALEEARAAYATFASFEEHGYGQGFLALVRTCRTSRGFGDFWGHMLVASGRMDLMAEPVVNPWDLAALLVIVEEAGGRFTDLGGRRRYDGGSALSSNGVLHDAALGLLGGRSGV